ncbi:Sec63-domain-containing protein [Meredithblackwellia eburnea MCA 4105]
MDTLSILQSFDTTVAPETPSALSLVQSLGPSLQLPLPELESSFDNDPAPSLLKASASSPLASSSTQPPSALSWLKSVLSADLVPSAIKVLQGPTSDDDVGGSLLELFGYDGIENVQEAVGRRKQIVQEAEHEEPEDAVAMVVDEDRPQMHRPTNHFYEESAFHSATARSGTMHVPQAQVTFQTAEEIAAAKRARKAARHKGKGKDDEEGEYMDLEAWERIREEELARGPGALVSGKRAAVEDEEQYPNVYLSNKGQASQVFLGQRMTLPIGTMREERGEYEEITIPAPKPVPFRFNEAPVPIREMDEWGQRTFHAYKSLNRLQSIVYPIAYKTNENMLVCAPTGAGKTDVALLTILRCLSTLVATPLQRNTSPSLPPASTYKIIYVAPLKALAAEVTQKFAKRLSWAGVKVRELTGDMKLTRQEVEETGIIVTTPEKWDVVTRKGAGTGDGEVAEKVKLLIIDEVHLLHEDRGAVIESIVARTLRQVESSQSLIRIVGLSATLPNYVDVADFLRVNRYQGLFYFDASFRPVPLEQHFIGVKGKPGSIASRTGLDNATFEKVADLLKAGHQVMVFVHARKDTVNTAQMLREKAQQEGIMDLLDPNDNERWFGFKRDIGSSRNREMKELAGVGFGIHHAGMLRSDRNITERMFEANVTKVLCCTATLAWGVNLPAYAVVIKGTQIYDSGKGAFVDLSILDVLQIFGRAGRPQYENQGVGYICTTMDKLDHYTQSITQQHPIESKFVEGLDDSLNAEISLGTVTTVDEGVRWLGYSYLFVRMRKNPLVYGIPQAELMRDPLLGGRRNDLISLSAKRLVAARMIEFDQDLGTLVPLDLGRIASRYYIRNASIEVFNKIFEPRMNAAQVLALIASSVEFAQITVRENEVIELRKLIETASRTQIKDGTLTSAGKVNVLLQAYISRAYVDDFALVSDTSYVAQNGARIVRALLEIAMSKRWAPVSLALMEMSKSIEKRMWSFEHPLRQFDLPADLLYNIEHWADDYSVHDIVSMSDSDFGKLIHQNERLGGMAIQAARQLPSLSISHTLQPVTHDLLRIRLELQPEFTWNEKRHGTLEAFWVWVEDESQLTILQLARLVVPPSTKFLVQEFLVPVDSSPTSIFVRAVSDRWLNDDEAHEIDLRELILPPAPPPHLPLLDIPLLRINDALSEHPKMRDIYSSHLAAFDPVQTQAFHSVFHSSNNVLICAPSAPSRGTLLEMAIWRVFKQNPKARVLFLTPRKALSRSCSIRMRRTFASSLGVNVSCITRSADVDSLPSEEKAMLAVSSAAHLLKRLLAKPQLLGRLDLIIAHDLHALDTSYELLLTRLRWTHPSARVVGSSSSLQDASDLAIWLGVPEMSTYAFAPDARSVSLTTSYQSFTGTHSMALLRTMIKPAYDAMRKASSTLCFVPSRAQCRSTARDLVTQTASDLEESFVNGPLETVETYAQTLSDPDLSEALVHGIAVFHDGMRPEEQSLALRLFASGYIRVLIAPREACWTLPVQASLVLLLSAQYTVIRSDHEREVQDYPLPEVLQMQTLAAPGSNGGSAECLILCQKEQVTLYGRFLLQGIPLESSLANDPVFSTVVLLDAIAGRIQDRQGVVDFLSWTFLSHRLKSNPAHYNSNLNSDRVLSWLADDILDTLESHACILKTGDTDFAPSLLGRLFSDNGLDIYDIADLQELDLKVMLERASPAGATSKGASEGEIADSTITNFHQRLPRGVRDSIGSLEGLSAVDLEKKVLLAAFKHGRVPRNAPSLEQMQRDLVRKLLAHKA